MGALAAAGLASEAAAAATSHASVAAGLMSSTSTVVHTQAFAPVALDAVQVRRQRPDVEPARRPRLHRGAELDPSRSGLRGARRCSTRASAMPARRQPTVRPTQAPVHDQFGSSAIPLSANVVMPSARQIAGLKPSRSLAASASTTRWFPRCWWMRSTVASHGATIDAVIERDSGNTGAQRRARMRLQVMPVPPFQTGTWRTCGVHTRRPCGTQRWSMQHGPSWMSAPLTRNEIEKAGSPLVDGGDPARPEGGNS